MELENYLSKLEEEIGEITSVSEQIPDVYVIKSRPDEHFAQEYYVVLDTAPIAEKVRNYGRKADNLRLYAVDNDSSGWRIVQYEVSKYSVAVQKRPGSEYLFRDMTLHAMEVHPEYFGMFPVPTHTTCGYTLLYRTLANGIYWLETSECKELLTVCFPVWNAELSPTAAALCKMLPEDLPDGAEASIGYRFFTKEASCIPLYELLETRREWDGTVIDRRALMNAIWKFMPEYAMRLDGRKDKELEEKISEFVKTNGLEPFPEPHKDRIVYLYPEAGTDFLLLR